MMFALSFCCQEDDIQATLGEGEMQGRLLKGSRVLDRRTMQRFRRLVALHLDDLFVNLAANDNARRWGKLPPRAGKR
jgi:hypothetical protein